jgi:MFS family permease
MNTTAPEQAATMRALFAGRRGRLLIALLCSEFGAAVQSVAYSSVLPVAANQLHGADLYGLTLGAGSFTTILFLAIGPSPWRRIGPPTLLVVATTLYLVGSGLCAGATAMVLVVIGTVIRGAASGLLGGLTASALGGLFHGEARTRVYGMYAMVWLLPSIAGPVVSSALTVAFGWRVALAWPAAFVLLGRLLVGRKIGMIPWKRSTAARPSPAWTLCLLLGLVLAATATAVRGYGWLLLAVGCVLATVGSMRILRLQIGAEWDRLLRTVVLFGLSLAFFGGAGIVSLAAVAGLGHGVVAGSLAVGAGLTAWSLTGLKPAIFDKRLPAPTAAGLALLTTALITEVLSQAVLDGTAALTVLVLAWAAAGAGMGLAYPRISSAAMDSLPRERTYPVASAVTFSEAAGTAVGSFIGGQTYSLAHAVGLSAHAGIAWAYVVLSLISATTLSMAVKSWGRH